MTKEKEIVESEEFKQPMELGDIFVQSGLFSDVKTKAQAVVKILAGKELGLTPFQSMASIFIVGGKLALTSNAMASQIKRSKKYDYQVTKLTDDGCEIDFFEVNDKEKVKLGTSIFGKVDAARAGLINKENYKNYPKNMYFARCLSNGARFYCPDAISGYYVSEELEDLYVPQKDTVVLTEDGEVINGKA